MSDPAEAITPAKLKVTELKTQLTARGLPTTGLKAVLVARLEEALQSSSTKSENTGDNDDNKDLTELEAPASPTSRSAGPVEALVPAVVERQSKSPEPKEIRRSNRGASMEASVKEPTTSAVEKSKNDKSEKISTNPKNVESSTAKTKDSAANEETAEAYAKAKSTRAPVSSNEAIVEIPEETEIPDVETVFLRIDGFKRPFTLPACKQMLEEYGSIADFWMAQMKTHAFIKYENVDAAKKALLALNGKVWPHLGGTLRPKFVNESDFSEAAAAKLQTQSNLTSTSQPPTGTGTASAVSASIPTTATSNTKTPRDSATNQMKEQQESGATVPLSARAAAPQSASANPRDLRRSRFESFLKAAANQPETRPAKIKNDGSLAPRMSTETVVQSPNQSVFQTQSTTTENNADTKAANDSTTTKSEGPTVVRGRGAFASTMYVDDAQQIAPMPSSILAQNRNMAKDVQWPGQSEKSRQPEVAPSTKTRQSSPPPPARSQQSVRLPEKGRGSLISQTAPPPASRRDRDARPITRENEREPAQIFMRTVTLPEIAYKPRTPAQVEERRSRMRGSGELSNLKRRRISRSRSPSRSRSRRRFDSRSRSRSRMRSRTRSFSRSITRSPSRSRSRSQSPSRSPSRPRSRSRSRVTSLSRSRSRSVRRGPAKRPRGTTASISRSRSRPRADVSLQPPRPIPTAPMQFSRQNAKPGFKMGGSNNPNSVPLGNPRFRHS